ncbi:DNA-processing protein DprA [Nannocystaceae bacterium ST9]
MSAALSPNTQAILLLSAPLILARGSGDVDVLTPLEYQRIARRLRELDRQPSDLLGQGSDELLESLRPLLDPERARRLLARGFALGQALERWAARAIWVMSRADAEYPRRLKARLREAAPALLYGCGDPQLLGAGGLAVVGSHDVDEGLLAYTEAIGRLTGEAGQTLVSGGGVDQAAMQAAARAGGRVVGVLADSLERAVLTREHRDLLLDGRLVLVSPYDPAAGFDVGHAMQRNELIYALADAALVVQSDLDEGTWAGASEQLDQLRLTRIYVRSTGQPSMGLDALRRKGAEPWPNPHDGEGLLAALREGDRRPDRRQHDSFETGLP